MLTHAGDLLAMILRITSRTLCTRLLRPSRLLSTARRVGVQKGKSDTWREDSNARRDSIERNRFDDKVRECGATADLCASSALLPKEDVETWYVTFGWKRGLMDERIR